MTNGCQCSDSASLSVREAAGPNQGQQIQQRVLGPVFLTLGDVQGQEGQGAPCWASWPDPLGLVHLGNVNRAAGRVGTQAQAGLLTGTSSHCPPWARPTPPLQGAGLTCVEACPPRL